MKFFIVYILFSLSILSYGQYSKIDSLTLREFNEKWIEELLKLDDKEVKLELIIQRIKTGKIVSDLDLRENISIEINNYSLYDTIDLSEASKQTNKCKILFVLDNMGSMYLLDLIKFPHFSNVFEDFTTETIEEIQYIIKDEALPIYGSAGNCGVVVLKSNDKKLKRLIRKSRKKYNPK